MKKGVIIGGIVSAVSIAAITVAVTCSVASNQKQQASLNPQDQQVVSNHEHMYVANVIAPTCESKGYTEFVCSCGDSYKQDYVDALGHTYGEWEVVLESTDTQDGLQKKSCVSCGDEITEAIAKKENSNVPSTDEPAVDEPVVDEPVVDEPVVDEPVVDEPVVDEPVVDEPVVDEPVVDEPVVDEPVVDEPVVDKPVVDEPVVDEPVVDEPAVDEPAVDENECPKKPHHKHRHHKPHHKHHKHHAHMHHIRKEVCKHIHEELNKHADDLKDLATEMHKQAIGIIAKFF